MRKASIEKAYLSTLKESNRRLRVPYEKKTFQSKNNTYILMMKSRIKTDLSKITT